MKEAAYAEIKKRILANEFAQGRLLSERQLAVRLEMSQTPVRAALEKLQIEGLVALSPQPGIVVCEISVHDIAIRGDPQEAERMIRKHLESGKAILLSPRGG
jgi:DNA-binding GntR family transcriptional regulator